jgi:long-chain fatty acid transport protein
LSPGTRIGVTYISKVEPDFSGDLKINTGGGPAFSTNSNLEFTFPQLVRVGAYHELDDQWALLGTVGWEDWSEFDELLVSTQAGGAAIGSDIPSAIAASPRAWLGLASSARVGQSRTTSAYDLSCI